MTITQTMAKPPLPDDLTWWDGAAIEPELLPAKRTGGLLTPPPCGGLHSEDVRSIPSLIAEKSASGDLTRFKAIVRALPTADTQSLILRIATTTDPLTLWAIHCTLDKRDIAPALRWPENDESPQAEFINYSADLLWFCKRNRSHFPLYRGWRGAFTNYPASPKWHATIHRQFVFLYSRYALSFKTAKGLALTDTQRQNLMVLQTNAMQSERRQLHTKKFAMFREHLLTHAVEHPDKSGLHRPEAIANRRAGLWRVYVLSGRDKTATSKNWQRLTGETMTRQAIAKQLVIVADVRGGQVMNRHELLNRDLAMVLANSKGIGLIPATPLQPAAMRVEGVAHVIKLRGCSSTGQAHPLHRPCTPYPEQPRTGYPREIFFRAVTKSAYRKPP